MSKDESRLDGKVALAFSVESTERISDSIGLPVKASLTVVCRRNETIIYLDLHDYMGSDPLKVKYKIDDGPVRTIRSSVSADGRVAGWWNGTGIPLLKNMRAGKRLVISAPPWGEMEKEAAFNIDGASQVVAAIGKACKWH